MAGAGWLKFFTHSDFIFSQQRDGRFHFGDHEVTKPEGFEGKM